MRAIVVLSEAEELPFSRRPFALLSSQDKKLSELPEYKALLETFITKEIIPWGTFEQKYAEEIKAQTDIFTGEELTL